MSSIFLCHNSKDHSFINWLQKELGKKGIFSWVDEGEIKVGDSLIWKIEEGIKNTIYFGAILSKNSVKSNWVKKELEMAITKEIGEGKIFILPIVIDDCEIPLFLKGKKFADFRESDDKGLMDLLEVLIGKSHFQCILFRQLEPAIYKKGYKQRIDIKNYSNIEYKNEKVPVICSHIKRQNEYHFAVSIKNITKNIKKDVKIEIKPTNSSARILDCYESSNVKIISGGKGANYIEYNVSLIHPYDEIKVNYIVNKTEWSEINIISELSIWDGLCYKIDIIPGKHTPQ